MFFESIITATSESLASGCIIASLCRDGRASVANAKPQNLQEILQAYEDYVHSIAYSGHQMVHRQSFSNDQFSYHDINLHILTHMISFIITLTTHPAMTNFTHRSLTVANRTQSTQRIASTLNMSILLLCPLVISAERRDCPHNTPSNTGSQVNITNSDPTNNSERESGNEM